MTYPTLFMNTSTATVDTPLRQAWLEVSVAMRAGSRLVASTYCFKYASVSRRSARKTRPAHRLAGVHKHGAHYSSRLRAVDLARRLGGFATNRHE